MNHAQAVILSKLSEAAEEHAKALILASGGSL